MKFQQEIYFILEITFAKHFFLKLFFFFNSINFKCNLLFRGWFFICKHVYRLLISLGFQTKESVQDTSISIINKLLNVKSVKEEDKKELFLIFYYFYKWYNSSQSRISSLKSISILIKKWTVIYAIIWNHNWR